jgi:hypothetical protein
LRKPPFKTITRGQRKRAARRARVREKRRMAVRRDIIDREFG